MNTRNFLKALAVVALAPLAALGKPSAEFLNIRDEDRIKLRDIYRLDPNGCNPRRIRMKDLKQGDLFLWSDGPQHVSSIQRCCSTPVYGEALPGVMCWHTITEQVFS